MLTTFLNRAINVFLILSCFYVSSFLILERQRICHWLPGMTNLYEIFGFPISAKSPLLLKNLTAHVISYKGKDILSVTGTIVNTSRKSIVVPPLAIRVLSQEGSPLYTWTHEASKRTSQMDDDEGLERKSIPLGAMQSELFRARLASPPQDAYSVGVFFMKQGNPSL
jgi:hypothetical protein